MTDQLIALLALLLISLIVLQLILLLQTRKYLRILATRITPTVSAESNPSAERAISFFNNGYAKAHLEALTDKSQSSVPALSPSLNYIMENLQITQRNKSSSKRIAICSIAIGEEFTQTVRPCLESQEAFARKHDYSYYLVSSRTDPERHPSWLKLPLLCRLIEQYQHVIFIDADAMITNENIGLEPLFATLDNSGRHLMLTEDEAGINCGVILIRNSANARRVLDLTWSYDVHFGAATWEQYALKTLINTFPQVETQIYTEKDPRKFNSFPVERGTTREAQAWSTGDLLCHFSGLQNPRLQQCIAQYQETLRKQ